VVELKNAEKTRREARLFLEREKGGAIIRIRKQVLVEWGPLWKKLGMTRTNLLDVYILPEEGLLIFKRR
jgi:hypothetical protein